jgi:hypothetical protein
MKRFRVLGAALGLLLLTSPASGDDGPKSSFQAFEGRTDAFAAGLSSKQLQAAPVPIEAFLTRTRTEVNSQPRSQAYAGIIDVPLGELASMFGFPGKLPNYCYSDYPGEPDNQCGGGAGVTHAEGDGFNLDATAAESSVSAARHSDQQVTIGASYSHGASRIVDGVLQTATEVVLQQVRLGDALAFEELRSSAAASTNGEPGGAKSAAALTVSGITVMGQRVPVPDQLDLSKLVKEVLAPLADQLAAQGITVQVVSPPTTTAGDDGREAVGSVSGLLVESVEPATGNRIAVSLGVARASAVAVPAVSSDDGPIVDTGPLPPLPDPLPAGTGDGIEPGTAEQSEPFPESVLTPVADPAAAGSALRSAAGSSLDLPSVSVPDRSVASAPPPDGGADDAQSPPTAGPATGRLSTTLASEVIGKRVADRLPVAYGLASGVIVLLGLLAFRLARGA